MAEARVSHTATALNDGTVLIVGGANRSGVARSAELFDPRTNTFAKTGFPIQLRYLHTATLLSDGRVLLVGGIGRANIPLGDAEIYDPKSRTFIFAAKLNYPRYWHAATLLLDGRVLISGGYRTGQMARIAEIYDPLANRFTVVANLLYARAGHFALRLPNGNVVVVGGRGYDYARPDFFWETKYAEAEVFDVRRNAFTRTDNTVGSRLESAAVTLPDGRPAFFGGGGGVILQTTNIYDPATGTFLYLDGPGPRRLHTATLMKNGYVMMIGGLGLRNQFDSILNNTEVFDSTSGSFLIPAITSSSFLKEARHSHTATLLPDGRILVAGGLNRSGALASAEILVPQ
ncbi:MAG TPA: kelch repeat-containing protein [Thermoanaerobaculia bacterium]|nr:kelch repeat-containing protein [Thermoanaerobaculia bacterium]